MSKLPAFQFYPGDWMKDTELRLCSIFARGLLVDLLCLMFEAKHRGTLSKADGVTPLTDEQVVDAVGGGSREQKLEGLSELLENGVLKRNEQGIIYSARLLRDEQVRKARAESGSKGGSKKAANRVANGVAKPVANSTPSSSSSSSSSKGKKKTKTFEPPTVEEVRDYCDQRANRVDAVQFVNFYTSKGWMIGKNRMSDWKAAVRTWESDKGNNNGQGSYQPRLTANQQREQNTSDAFDWLRAAAAQDAAEQAAQGRLEFDASASGSPEAR